MAGYSSTPLAQKLGIKPGHVIKLVHQPGHYSFLFNDWPEGVTISASDDDRKDVIHCFFTRADALNDAVKELKKEMKANGMLWISWPKKSSGVKTDITEDAVRNIGLKTGLVDVKVCAIDETWSGLKFVFRLRDRPAVK